MIRQAHRDLLWLERSVHCNAIGEKSADVFDIHAHILPALDDGPRTAEEAIATISALAAEGITGIVATPHFNDRYPHVAASEVQAHVNRLQCLVYQAGISVQLWAGHEVHLDAGVAAALAQGLAATINHGPYVLLELPTHEFPVFLHGLIGQIRSKGFVPVIAHAERYTPVWQNPEVLIPLIEAGALLQITASSLVGFFGRRARQTAEMLLQHNLAHVLASDAHAVSDRPPRFATGLRAAEALMGRERVREMVIEVPRAIVYGGPVAVPRILAPPRMKPGARAPDGWREIWRSRFSR
jgi:protein-tyrosine phosphatase